MRLIVIVLTVFLFVGCGSSKKSLTGKKIRNQELIDKATYRANLNKEAAKSGKKLYKNTETLEATSKLSVTSDVIRAYIMRYKDVAKTNMRKHGIPASITLAQGVLESGSGQGTLSRNANNHFGIKCHDWTGDSVRHTDDAPDECFRKYSDPEESYKDHSIFLTSRGRYSDLFKLDKSDYKGWAKGLRKAGYATDPKYPDKLISLIERYELYNFDSEVLGNKYNTSAIDKAISGDAVVTSSYHKVVAGDTLYSISKRYNITVSELQNLNNLSDNSISTGQLLKIN
ncbi:glucosaminidase domain-containing protein [Myroides guanonis]|uniref:Peptidoglycan hydrolase n=1 Tax=Myroides guanonis TaxID=1150112 RepID=A0A1I3ME94_9FLAO|nr:glucosaminidase domain-containing protein [Myroides guanonis]SFI95016.1 Flagellum-specific peptidoglycan hydrolase FlgJ [Myroides guanonis]